MKPAVDNADSRGDSSRPESDWWNEISIVHYASIRHFCDMLAGPDYQAVNEKYRLAVSVPASSRFLQCADYIQALRDTFLLCTTELDLEESASARL